jgi:hypothetical protein
MSTAITKTIGLNDPKNPDEPTKQLYSNCLDTDRVWITQDIDKFFKKLKNQI